LPRAIRANVTTRRENDQFFMRRMRYVCFPDTAFVSVTVMAAVAAAILSSSSR
jgi:hypothetical protein